MRTRKVILIALLLAVVVLSLCCGGCGKQTAKTASNVGETLTSLDMQIFVVDLDGDVINALKASYKAKFPPNMKIADKGKSELSMHTIGQTDFAKKVKKGDWLILRRYGIGAFKAQFVSGEYNKENELVRLTIANPVSVTLNDTVRALPKKPSSVTESEEGIRWSLNAKAPEMPSRIATNVTKVTPSSDPKIQQAQAKLKRNTISNLKVIALNPRYDTEDWNKYAASQMKVFKIGPADLMKSDHGFLEPGLTQEQARRFLIRVGLPCPALPKN